MVKKSVDPSFVDELIEGIHGQLTLENMRSFFQGSDSAHIRQAIEEVQIGKNTILDEVEEGHLIGVADDSEQDLRQGFQRLSLLETVLFQLLLEKAKG